MVWNSTAPDGTKSVATNRQILQDNTTYTETEMNKDHFWNIGADEDGHHKHCIMQKSATDPIPGTNMDLAYFARIKTALESPDNEDVQPFVINDDVINGGNAVMQLLGIRAMGMFNKTTVNGPVTLKYSHNCTVERTSTGNYTVTFGSPVASPLPSNNYSILGDIVIFNNNQGNQPRFTIKRIASAAALTTVKSTAFCKIETFSSTTVTDAEQTWFVVFGG